MFLRRGVRLKTLAMRMLKPLDVGVTLAARCARGCRGAGVSGDPISISVNSGLSIDSGNEEGFWFVARDMMCPPPLPSSSSSSLCCRTLFVLILFVA